MYEPFCFCLYGHFAFQSSESLDMAQRGNSLFARVFARMLARICYLVDQLSCNPSCQNLFGDPGESQSARETKIVSADRQISESYLCNAQFESRIEDKLLGLILKKNILVFINRKILHNSNCFPRKCLH